MFKKSALKLATIATVVGSALSYSAIANAATEIKAAFNQSDKHPQYLALKDFGENETFDDMDFVDMYEIR